MGTLDPCEQDLVLVLLKNCERKPHIDKKMGAYRSAPWTPKKSGRGREVLASHHSSMIAEFRHHSSPTQLFPLNPCAYRCKDKMNILQHNKSVFVLILRFLPTVVRWGYWGTENEEMTGCSLLS